MRPFETMVSIIHDKDILVSPQHPDGFGVLYA